MELPLQSRWYFANMVLSTTLGVLTFGLLWFITLPFKKISNEFLRWGALFVLKTQLWLRGAIDLQKLNHAHGLYIANHRSILDTFILLAMIPNLKLVAKRQLFKIPFLGFLLSISKQIPIDVSDLNSINLALEKINEYQETNIPVLIYPEMTRCKLGFKGVQKFAHFPFNYAWNKNYHITPIVLHNTDWAWQKGSFALRKIDRINIDILTAQWGKTFKSSEDLKKYFYHKFSTCIEARL